MDCEAGEEGLEGGGGWWDGELWRPTGQREAGAVCGLSPSSLQVEKPVYGPPREPPPGPDMKRRQIFVLWVFWVLILWLMTPYLDLTPESAPQEKRIYLVPWRCDCPWFSSGKCGCPSETLNCSSCHHTADEWNWLDVCSRKTMGYLIRTTESMTSDTVLWWLVSGQHWARPYPPCFPGLTHLPLSAQIPALGPVFTASGWRSHPPSSVFSPLGPAPNLPLAVSRA